MAAVLANTPKCYAKHPDKTLTHIHNLQFHYSACRFAGESFVTGASTTQLSTKLLSLLQDCICAHLFPELQRRLDKLKAAVTPAAKLLLKKGRRCVRVAARFQPQPCWPGLVFPF